MKKSLTRAISFFVIIVMLASMLIGCRYANGEKKNYEEKESDNDVVSDNGNSSDDNTVKCGYVVSRVKYTLKENGNLISLYDQKVLFDENNLPYKGDLTRYDATYGSDGSIKENNYEYIIEVAYDGEGRIIKSVYTLSGSGNSTSEYVYDSAGNLIEEIKTTSRQTEKHVYTYDLENRCVSEDYIFNGERRSLTTWAYDSDGNFIEWRYEYDDGSYQICNYFYENGRLIKDTKKYYDRDGELRVDAATFHEYDVDGNLICKKSTNDGGAIFANVSIFVYENGVLVHDEFINHGDVYNMNDYTYDSEGNLIKQVNNQSGVERIFEYVFDNNGNEIRRVTTYADGTKTIYETTYDSEGRIVSTYQNDPGDGERLINNTYDAHGNLVKTEELHIVGDNRYEAITEYEYTYLFYDITDEEMYELVDWVCWFEATSWK